VIEAVNINPDFLTQTRDLTRYKKIAFYAKIDGVNWYDLSDYVLKVRTNNRIELLETPAIDTAVLTVRNENNAFTPTQYNDVFDPTVGKINGTVNDDYLNKVWEVKVYVIIGKEADGLELPDNVIEYWRGSLNDTVPDGYTAAPEDENAIAIPIFYGWKPANAITERHKTADIELKDLLWIATQKKPTNPLLYTGYTPDQIINDILVNRLGFDVSYLDLQVLTTPWEVFIADNNKTWWQILQEITKATGGKLTCTPDGKIAFRTRIENYSDPTPAITITEDNIKNYNINTKRQFNQIKIQSQGYEIGSAQEHVIDHELQGDASIVKAGTQGTFELEYTSEYIKDPDTYVYISYYLNDTPIAVDRQFSAGYNDGNIRLDELTAYPDKLILKITNLSSTVDYRITHIKFSAVPIKKKSELTVTKPNQTGQPDAELSLTSYYSSEALLSNIADALYGETTKTIKFVLQLNEFYPELFAGNLITLQLAPKGISSGTFLINGVEHELEAQKFKTSISIVEWGNVIFDIADKQVSKVTPSEVAQQPAETTQLETVQQQVQELQTQVQTVDDRTNYLDGLAPATPTGLALATINENGLNFITASWNANTEADLIGYELAWSYDGIDWNYITTADTLVKFEVPGNMTIYVKVRAYDAEGKKSGWSTVQSITSAKDTDAPATPTLVSTESLYGAAIIKVTEPTEDDFSHFLVTVNLETVRVDSTTIRVELSPGSTNVPVEIRAVDFSGNQSSPLTVNVSSKTLSEAEQSFADVQTDVANLQADVSGIQSDITTINNDISTIETILNSAPDATNQYYAIKTNADGISTLFAKTDVNSLGVGETLYSKITQNASDISTLVAKTGINSLGETETLYSKITQNADSITSIVATLNGDANDPSQYSAIKQNATSISTIVATLNDTPDAANQYSSIKQNASEISNLVVKTGINSLGENETLYSKITQNADSITSIVATLNSDANDPNQYSAIKQNASQISTVVADVSSIDSDLSDLTTAATRWSSFQQLSDEINLRVVAKDETGTPQATELSIQNGKIVVDATQFEVYGDAIVNGTLTGDKIQAKTISADKLVVQPANALPEGTIAYWLDSLVDVVNGIVPEGYTEINLAPSITLTPYNAPEGSVVGDLIAGNKIYAGKSIQVGNKVFIENTSDGKGIIRVNNEGVDLVKIGEASTPKYYETCEIYVDILGGFDSPEPRVYASLDGVTWIEIGTTQSLDRQMTKVGLFSLQKEGTTLYLKVKTTVLEGAEDGEIKLYVDGSLAYTFYYSVKALGTNEQIFSYTLPSSPSDGISISGGLLETPQIVLSNTAGKILFADSYWEITDGQEVFEAYTELTINFTNKYFDDKIIFFEIARGFGLRFEPGGNTLISYGEIFNTDNELIIGKYDERTGRIASIILQPDSGVRIDGGGLMLPISLTAPDSPVPGMIYFNRTDKHFYGYNGSSWVRLD
jgi:hypothetical protein